MQPVFLEHDLEYRNPVTTFVTGFFFGFILNT